MPRPPASPTLPELRFRTTPRDRYLAAMLYEHRALTARQIAELAFPSLRAANRRLAELAQLAVTDRTAARTSPHTTGPYLYTLGPAGALLVGAAHDLSVKELRYDRAVLLRQAARPDLPHTLGCNTLMIHLAVRHRTDPSVRLTTWWGPISCLRLWGDAIRPDAYAVTTHQPATAGSGLGWFFEYDTGTESITQLAAKLRAYHRFSQNYTGHHPVLIHLPTTSREQRLHEVIAETYGPSPVPVATTTGELAEHVWRIVGEDPTRAGLHPLADLHAAFTAGGYRLLPAQTSDHEIYAPNPTRD